MRLQVNLEVSLKGQTMAHVVEHPGCTAMGHSREAVLQRLPRIIAGHRGWLRLHGRQVPRLTPHGIEVEVLQEQEADPALFESGSQLALFESDRQALSDEEIDARLELATFARDDLHRLAGHLPAEEREAPREGRTLHGILEHLAYVEFWYAWAVHPEWPEPEEEPPDVWALLDFARQAPVRGLRELPAAQRHRTFHRPAGTGPPEEPWTQTKALRRLLEHHLEHNDELWTLLHQAGQTPPLYVPSPWVDRAHRPISGTGVELAPPDPAWQAAFRAERARLQEALGKDALAIEHVGSTAIPGIRAKPIIDIGVGLTSLDAGLRHMEGLLRLGYLYVPEYEDELPYRLYLKRDGSPAVHLHAFEHESQGWQEHILFRDHLRAHPQVARTYQRVKMDLARRHRADREAYTEAKSAFIREVTATACASPA